MLNVKNRHLSIGLLAFIFTANIAVAMNDSSKILIGKGKQKAEEQIECPICFESLKDLGANGVSVQRLNCSCKDTEFCSPCINSHIAAHSYVDKDDKRCFNCPVCNIPVPVATEIAFLPGEPDLTPPSPAEADELLGIAGATQHEQIYTTQANNHYQLSNQDITHGNIINEANQFMPVINNTGNMPQCHNSLQGNKGNTSINAKFYITEALAAFTAGLAAYKVKSSSEKEKTNVQGYVALVSGLILGNKALSVANPNRLDQPGKLAATWLIGSALGYLTPKLLKK